MHCLVITGIRVTALLEYLNLSAQCFFEGLPMHPLDPPLMQIPPCYVAAVILCSITDILVFISLANIAFYKQQHYSS